MTGAVTGLVPFGVYVRLEVRADGPEGLVHVTEPADGRADRPEDVVRVGDRLTVKIVEVDLPRHRITHPTGRRSPRGALTGGGQRCRGRSGQAGSTTAAGSAVRRR
ncbi:S1 RNA-binding domain-containing protein [Streptomyces sp. NPDC001770]